MIVDLGAFRLLHEGLVQVSECCMWSTLPEKVLRLPDDGGDDDVDYNDQHKNSGSGVGDDDEKNVEEEDDDDDEKRYLR